MTHQISPLKPIEGYNLPIQSKFIINLLFFKPELLNLPDNSGI